MQHAQSIEQDQMLSRIDRIRGSLSGSLLMITQFLKSPKEIGSVMASSDKLSDEMLRYIDFKTAKTIVELGPGVGALTKDILKKASPHAKIICIEVNKAFCDHLEKRINDRRLTIVHAGAGDLVTTLDTLGLKKTDGIISGLPFRNFPMKERTLILNNVKKTLGSNGTFVLFQYTNGLSDLLKSHFTRVRKHFVLLNVPPSFVYICQH